jgi:hypothetical protein
MKISYSYPGMRLAIFAVHYDKVMKMREARQIKTDDNSNYPIISETSQGFPIIP